MPTRKQMRAGIKGGTTGKSKAFFFKGEYFVIEQSATSATKAAAKVNFSPTGSKTGILLTPAKLSSRKAFDKAKVAR